MLLVKEEAGLEEGIKREIQINIQMNKNNRIRRNEMINQMHD